MITMGLAWLFPQKQAGETLYGLILWEQSVARWVAQWLAGMHECSYIILLAGTCVAILFCWLEHV